MRYLGLDVGKRKIGVASGEMLASELTTLTTPKDIDFYSPVGIKLAAEKLKIIISEQQAKIIIAGLPVDEHGQSTEESNKISEFCSELSSKLKIPFEFVDETLTSFMASDMLEEQGLGKEEIAQREHQLAAQLILQQYFEEHANT
jgi:putative Holliday junction resolvase